MRHVGKYRYLYKRCEEACIFMEQTCLGWVFGVRFIGPHIALINGFLVFWVYLCPVILTYWKIYNFGENLWLLGLVLTWSGMASTSIASLVDSFINYQDIAEECERVLELQRQYPIANINPYLEKIKDLKDELNEEDLAFIFIQKTEPYQISFDKRDNMPIIQLKNASYESKSFKYIHQASFELFPGEKIIMIDDNANTTNFLKNLILGFQNPDSYTSNDPGIGPSFVKVFGKDIRRINKYHMRLRMMYLPSSPHLFIGTLRDNVDPFRMFMDDEIVRVLHYFGFYNAYCAYLKKNKESEMERLLTNVNFDIMGDDWRLVFCGRREWAKKALSFNKKMLSDFKKRELSHLPPVVYYNTPKIKNFKALFKLQIKIKIIIALNRLLQEVRNRIRRVQEDILLSKEIQDKGYIVEIGREVLERKGFSARMPAVKSIYRNPTLASKEAGREKVQIDEATCKLLKYRIQNSNEKEVLHKLLNSWVSSEYGDLSLNMRRIAYLTRAVLERPDLIVLDEDALLLEETNDEHYLRSVFAALRESTVICTMRNFKIIQYFDKCATFCGPRLVEFDKLKNLLGDPFSYTSALISKSDTRKLSLASISKRRRSTFSDHSRHGA